MGAAERRVTGRAIELDGTGWVVPKDETVVVMTTRTRSAIVQAQPAARLEWFAMAMVDGGSSSDPLGSLW